VEEVFNNNYQPYGTMRLWENLRKQSITVSQCRIGRIIEESGWVSKYTCKKYCYNHNIEKSNESTIKAYIVAQY
jgi:putative transposase